MTTENSGGEQRLEFAILGPLEVVRGGARLRLGGRQQRAILGLLLCEAGRVVSTGRLADALWGEQLPAGYLTTVQTYVFHLRELLEPGRERGAPGQVLVSEPGGGYRLHVAKGRLDAKLFEELLAQGTAALEGGDSAQALGLFDRALGLWRGEVLGDLADFAFVAPVAGRLQELRLAAMESRMEAELALGHHGAAVAELDLLVVEHPLRERLHAERILALYRSGRQSDALGAYRALRSLLHEELGIEPSPPLHELHRAVLAQDPVLAWHPTTTPAGAPGDGHEAGGDQGGSARAAAPGVLVPDGSQPGSFRGRFGGVLGRRAVVVWAGVVLVATAGSVATVVWLSGPNGAGTLAANSVGTVESDGSISAAVRVGTNPVGLAVGGGAVWVADRSDGKVSRIDSATHAVQTIDVGAAPEALTVTAGDVWVANFADDTVTRINVAANKVVDTIAVGTGPAAIGSGPSGVWVANSGDDTIQRIDLITDRPDKAIGVGAGPDGIVVDAGDVWVANGHDGTVSRIDPNTRQEISSPIPVGSGPKGIAVSGDDVWVADQLSSSVTRIKRSTGLAQQSVQVGDGPDSVAVAAGAVWVSEEFDGALTRIDLATDAVRSFLIGSSPQGLAAVGGRVWVASGDFTSPTHRGGTLTVAAFEVPGYGDPADAYYGPVVSVNRLVYDGLVAFRLARGADSQVLVPDLALALPRPSNGGKTYTFTLRPGIKYSTGREVHASDFVLGVRRALTLTGGRPDFFAGIVGGQNCVEHPNACDLSAGVQTDDATGRVTFNLSAPDPEFLDKLSWFVYPTPPGTSRREVAAPFPGTGPYMIADYTKGKTFSLVRNSWFHQWSFAAQPNGYPDTIRWLLASDDRAALPAVSRGRADVARLDVFDSLDASALLNEFRVAHPDQVHSDLQAAIYFEVLNTTVPPFNNIKARQAFNDAVDRNKLVELYGGPSVAVGTCQMLPPNFPSYSWYCPYTTGPANGDYRGPDLAKARSLVEASGTRGISVTVYGTTDGANGPVNTYLKQVLGQLGYKATFHALPNTTAFEFLSTHKKLQVEPYGFGADFPLASNFYDALVACGAGSNVSEYCNRGLDQRAASATALEATDPGAALRAWTQIDRVVTESAQILPLANFKDTTVVSKRVGNYQSNQLVGPLLSQLWVR
jgi:YVTN family beta-propeller protein